MSDKFNIQLRPSRYFFTLISGFHLITVFFICISELNWWMYVILFFIVIFSYTYLLYKHIYRKTNFVVIKLWQSKDNLDPNIWNIQFSNNKIASTSLKPKGYMSDYLIIMSFKMLREGNYWPIFKYKTIQVLIFPDMLDYSDYTALKRFLLGY